MKLLRVGEKGKEIPAIVDNENNNRDLSSLVEDFKPSTLNFETLKKIKDSNLPEDIRIGASVRKDQVIIPRSNFIFEKDDLVVFLAKREQLKEVESIFSISSI